MVGHVRAVGILLVIQGALATFLGGIWMTIPLIVWGNLNAPSQPRINKDLSETYVINGFLVFGAVVMLLAIFQIVAGIRAYQFRNRVLVIVALISGFTQLFTCYCAPTSIALIVYGLIVLWDASVIRGFKLGEQGINGDQILNAHYQGQLS